MRRLPFLVTSGNPQARNRTGGRHHSRPSTQFVTLGHYTCTRDLFLRYGPGSDLITQGLQISWRRGASLFRRPCGQLFCRRGNKWASLHFQQDGVVCQSNNRMPCSRREFDANCQSLRASMLFSTETLYFDDRSLLIENHERKRAANCEQVLGFRVQRMSMGSDITVSSDRIEKALARVFKTSVNIQVLSLPHRLTCLLLHRIEQLGREHGDVHVGFPVQCRSCGQRPPKKTSR